MNKEDAPLIQKLLRLQEKSDRAALAELRRFWSATTRHRAYPILGRLGILDPSSWADSLTAALFAIHPCHATGGNSIGKACIQLAGGSPEASQFKATAAHFRRLLACETLEDIGPVLRRLFQRMEREKIPLDYGRVLWDLRNWNKAAEDIKTYWAADFWLVTQE